LGEPYHLECEGGQLQERLDVVKDDEELLVSDQAKDAEESKRLDEAQNAHLFYDMFVY
jgi:hypothetical protein